MTTIDLLLTGATVYPVSAPPIQRGAVAIVGDRIVAVGPAADLAALAGPQTRIVRLAPQQSLLPAFHDSHQHLLSFIRSRTRVSLWECATPAATLAALRDAALRQPPGSWVVAVGYDQGRFAQPRHPTLAELDAAIPDHPLLVYRACSHIALANSCALAIAGVTAETADPSDGRIGRSGGALTGVLEEGAMGLVSRATVAPPVDWRAGLRAAVAEYHRRGIVAVGEAALGHVDGLEDVARIADLADGALGMRMYGMAYGAVAETLLAAAEDVGRPLTQHEMAAALGVAGADGRYLRFGCIKYFIDGTLGGGTALLSQDYGDEPGNRGYPIMPQEELDAKVLRAHRAGFQLAVHAIGDAAAAMVLAAYDRALAALPRHDHRHRIEHLETINADVLARLARGGFVANIQSLFTYWESGDVTRLGPGLAPWGHAWRSLDDAGVPLANSSDNPVLPDFHPLQGLDAAIHRLTHADLALRPEQALTPAQALASYTAGAAYASFHEREMGALAPGMLADIVVLDGDYAVPPSGRQRDLNVTQTIAGGRSI